MSYTPTQSALQQRATSPNKCNSTICNQQREANRAPHSIKYKLYNFCNTCKTNWPKNEIFCGCCRLRTKGHGSKK
jgi:hypothetical protein